MMLHHIARCSLAAAALTTALLLTPATAHAQSVGFTIDGRPVDDARIVRFNNELFLVDADNRVITAIDPAPASAIVFSPQRNTASEGAAKRTARLAALADDLESRSIDPRRKFIGINLERPSRTLAAQLGIQANRSIVVTSVSQNSPAARAGLQRDDIIVAVNGSRDARTQSLVRSIRATDVGEPVTLEIIRAGSRRTIEVPVGLRRH